MYIEFPLAADCLNKILISPCYDWEWDTIQILPPPTCSAIKLWKSRRTYFYLSKIMISTAADTSYGQMLKPNWRSGRMVFQKSWNYILSIVSPTSCEMGLMMTRSICGATIPFELNLCTYKGSQRNGDRNWNEIGGRVQMASLFGDCGRWCPWLSRIMKSYLQNASCSAKLFGFKSIERRLLCVLHLRMHPEHSSLWLVVTASHIISD